MSLGFPRSAHQLMVDEFMMKAGQRLPTVPSLLTPEERVLRAKLIYEEALETIAALGIAVYHRFERAREDGSIPTEFRLDSKPNLIEIIDGCCDLKVVTTGTLSALGIPDVRFQKLVDDNNLAKFGPGGYRNEDGKWVKPPGHKPPDIEGLLKECYQFLEVEGPEPAPQ